MRWYQIKLHLCTKKPISGNSITICRNFLFPYPFKNQCSFSPLFKLYGIYGIIAKLRVMYVYHYQFLQSYRPRKENTCFFLVLYLSVKYSIRWPETNKKQQPQQEQQVKFPAKVFFLASKDIPFVGQGICIMVSLQTLLSCEKFLERWEDCHVCLLVEPYSKYKSLLGKGKPQRKTVCHDI